MGTIVKRYLSDGRVRYSAQILIKRAGAIVYRESKTFKKITLASDWLRQRECEVNSPYFNFTKDANVTLGDAIRKFIEAADGNIGRSQLQVLKTIETNEISYEKCKDISSARLVSFFRSLGATCQPQTVATYASCLSTVFSIAKPAWDIPLDLQEIRNATAAARRLKIIGKDAARARRPTLDELNRLLGYFEETKIRYPESVDMPRIILFAIFSARRQGEITSLRRLDFDGNRILVRDMKDPARGKGNDLWCNLPDRAVRLLSSTPNEGPLFFPYKSRTISTQFSRACKVLGISDLRFHDLRHEGASWLAELGWTIPQIASVTGHRGWQGLMRYSHFRQFGDRYQDWHWAKKYCE